MVRRCLLFAWAFLIVSLKLKMFDFDNDVSLTVPLQEHTNVCFAIGYFYSYEGNFVHFVNCQHTKLKNVCPAKACLYM